MDNLREKLKNVFIENQENGTISIEKSMNQVIRDECRVDATWKICSIVISMELSENIGMDELIVKIINSIEKQLKGNNYYTFKDDNYRTL